jgi:hypothetical protein
VIDLLPESDIPLVLREFQRVLRPPGRLVVTVMAVQAPVLQQVWMMLFRHFPALVGGCRPIPIAELLNGSGWDIEHREPIIQSGFRSELLTARSRLPAPS